MNGGSYKVRCCFLTYLPEVTWIKVEEIPGPSRQSDIRVPFARSTGEAPGPQLLSCGGKPHQLKEEHPLGLRHQVGDLSPAVTSSESTESPASSSGARGGHRWLGSSSLAPLASRATPLPSSALLSSIPFSPATPASPAPAAHPNLPGGNADPWSPQWGTQGPESLDCRHRTTSSSKVSLPFWTAVSPCVSCEVREVLLKLHFTDKLFSKGNLMQVLTVKWEKTALLSFPGDVRGPTQKGSPWAPEALWVWVSEVAPHASGPSIESHLAW